MTGRTDATSPGTARAAVEDQTDEDQADEGRVDLSEAGVSEVDAEASDLDDAPAPRWPGIAGTLLSLIGVGLSAYLTWAHFQPAGSNALACPANSVINCEAVTTSSYATIWHVPVAVAGLVYFVVMLGFQLPVAWRARARWVHGVRLALAAAGVLMVFWLVYVELFRVDKICEYCTGVHLVTIILFAITAIASASALVDRADPVGD